MKMMQKPRYLGIFLNTFAMDFVIYFYITIWLIVKNSYIQYNIVHNLNKEESYIGIYARTIETQELLKKIKESAKFSQVSLTEELGVSFATINRWENRHVKEKRYEFCNKHSLPLYDFIVEKVLDIRKTINVEEDSIILYHGSK